jgi:NADH-quinone oxidoreductase subunit H
MAWALFHILVFPGFLFLVAASFPAEFLDRKLYARFQNRKGPPWFQPVADFIKLLGKENMMTEEADAAIFKSMPLFAMAVCVTAFLYIPLWGVRSLYSFNGDVIVVLYLLTIPTLTFFLGGWYARSVYCSIGAVRTITQLFAYEVPLLLAVLSSALLANTWSLGELTAFYARHPGYWLFNIAGFLISIVALIGKLEKVPFDIPEAETEIVAGNFTEYSGRLLALIRMSLNMEMVVGAALLSAVFLPWGLTSGPVTAFLLTVAKITFVIVLIALIRSSLARLRIDQMIELSWKYLAPITFAQVLFTLVLKGVLVS